MPEHNNENSIRQSNPEGTDQLIKKLIILIDLSIFIDTKYK